MCIIEKLNTYRYIQATTINKTTHMLHVEVLDAVFLEHGADRHHVAEQNDVALRELAQNAVCEVGGRWRGVVRDGDDEEGSKCENNRDGATHRGIRQESMATLHEGEEQQIAQNRNISYGLPGSSLLIGP